MYITFLVLQVMGNVIEFVSPVEVKVYVVKSVGNGRTSFTIFPATVQTFRVCG